ncbi:MAG: hypothetical protein U0X91_27770 [Spirosomataceae bacterium]
MKLPWTLSPKTVKLRKKGNHYDCINGDDFAAVRCVSGAYKSFADSFQPIQPMDTHSFGKAYEQACLDFRKSFRESKGREFEQENEAIIHRFAQIFIDARGHLSAFVYGGSRAGLYRNDHVTALEEQGMLCQEGDIVFINLEGETGLQKLMEAGDFTLTNNDYPALIFEVKKNLDVHSSPSPIAAPAVAPVTPEEVHSIKEVLISPEPQLSSPTPLVPKKEQPTKNWSKVAGIALTAGLIGAGSWFGYNYYAKTSATGLPDTTAFVSLDTLANAAHSASIPEPKPTQNENFAATDRILKEYYGGTPRDIHLLDRAIESLKKEAEKNPVEAATRQKELSKERQDLIKQLSEPFNEFLSKAQLSIEEGRLEEADKTLANANRYLDGTFRDLVNTDSKVRGMKTELSNRKKNLKQLMNDDFQ